jgi:hypothetical protein
VHVKSRDDDAGRRRTEVAWYARSTDIGAGGYEEHDERSADLRLFPPTRCPRHTSATHPAPTLGDSNGHIARGFIIGRHLAAARARRGAPAPLSTIPHLPLSPTIPAYDKRGLAKAGCCSVTHSRLNPATLSVPPPLVRKSKRFSASLARAAPPVRVRWQRRRSDLSASTFSSLLSACLHALALAEAQDRPVYANAVSSEADGLPGWTRPPFARPPISTLAPGLVQIMVDAIRAQLGASFGLP